MKKIMKIRVPHVPYTAISGEKMEEGEVICKIDDPKSYYENKRWPYLLVLPLSWLMTIWAMIKTIICKFIFKRLPKSTSIFFDRFSRPLYDIRLGAASWKALDIIYHWFEPDWRIKNYPKLSLFEELLANFWINMINAQAVRNRFRMAEQKLDLVIEEILSNNHNQVKEIKIFSIAAGSGEVIIREIATQKKKGILIKALLLDKNPQACFYARKLAEKYNVSEQLKIVQEDVRKMELVLEKENFKPDIIEMIGFLDYRPKKKAISLINRIYNLLPQKGLFLTCQIRRNPERWFLRWVISWWMIYRQPEELANLICDGGFKPENIEIFYEPHTIHGMVIARNG